MRHPLFSTVLALSLISATTPVRAQHHHGFRPMPIYRPAYTGWGWVAPAVIGGVVGYEIAHANQPVYIQQPPVVVQSPTVIIDGVTYVRQTVIINGVAQEVLVRQ